ncbi:hypothetical protein E2C01_059726 [Portunus trituberculatus]|uniref:Uncharacterized protein n=1 Tax=Portunus trituberculatus TaxID=210409 RepID=A0A5B7H984_PORTR|nr:hypothetical protein [Portunus trituberculatus]
MLAASFTPLKKIYEKQISKSSLEDLQDVEVLSWLENKTTGEPPRDIHSHDRERVSKGETSKEQTLTNLYRKNPLNPEDTAWGTLPSPSIQQETEALLFARRSLTVIEHLEATTTTLFAPIICLQILLDGILNVSFMMSVLPEDPRMLFIVLFFLGVGELRIYILLDAPEYYKKEVRVRHKWVVLPK